MTTQVNDNYGHLLENSVYLHLRRHTDEIYYYKTKEGFEVDFITHINGPKLIQVCYEFNNQKTKERETRALAKAMKELGVESSIVVTRNPSEKLQLSEGTIEVMEAQKFFERPLDKRKDI